MFSNMMVKDPGTPMIGHIVSGTGVVATVIFLSRGYSILFWISVSVVALLYITWWLLLCYARRGFSRRVSDLRTSLLNSRTLEKRLKGNHSIDPMEKDEVDVLIARLLRGTMEDIPGWAITEVYQINDLKGLVQENSDQVDPDAQPTWLFIISILLFIGCPILLLLALIMSIAG